MIDLERQELIFGDKDTYPVEIPMVKAGGTYYINLDLALTDEVSGVHAPIRYLLDTGQSSAIQLPGTFATQFEGRVYWESGFNTLLGSSVECKVFPYGCVRIGNKWMGPFEVWVGGKSVEPAVGIAFFQNCKVQFDFEHNKLRLKRYESKGSSPFGALKPLGQMMAR